MHAEEIQNTNKGLEFWLSQAENRSATTLTQILIFICIMMSSWSCFQSHQQNALLLSKMFTFCSVDTVLASSTVHSDGSILRFWCPIWWLPSTWKAASVCRNDLFTLFISTATIGFVGTVQASITQKSSFSEMPTRCQLCPIFYI